MKKIIFLVTLLTLILVGCEEPKEEKKVEKPNTLVEEIQVENIIVEEIEVETILYEDCTTYWD